MLIKVNEGCWEGNESLLITFSVPGTFHVFLLIPPVILEVDVNISILQMRKLKDKGWDSFYYTIIVLDGSKK